MHSDADQMPNSRNNGYVIITSNSYAIPREKPGETQTSSIFPHHAKADQAHVRHHTTTGPPLHSSPRFCNQVIVKHTTYSTQRRELPNLPRDTTGRHTPHLTDNKNYNMYKLAGRP
ncbi:unnamed protein product, partial [Ectocarpus sp. 8 AP-2014]